MPPQNKDSLCSGIGDKKNLPAVPQRDLKGGALLKEYDFHLPDVNLIDSILFPKSVHQ